MKIIFIELFIVIVMAGCDYNKNTSEETEFKKPPKYEKLDEKNGYQDLKFGMPYEEIKKKIKSEKGVEVNKWGNKDSFFYYNIQYGSKYNHVGDIGTKVELGFFKGQLMEIILDEPVVGAFSKEYGDGELFSDNSSIMWNGTIVSAFTSRSTSELIIYNNKLYNEWNSYKDSLTIINGKKL